MSAGRRRWRVWLALALGGVIGLVLPTPARASGAAARGSVVWSTPVVGGPLAVATDTHGAVYTTTLGDVVGLDRDGRRVWRASVATNPVGPAVTDDTVLVGDGQHVRAFGRGDGTPRWTAPTTAAPRHLAAGAGMVVVVDDRGVLAGLDLVTGDARWRYPGPGGVSHEPVIDAASGAVVAVVQSPGQPRLAVLDGATGSVRWEVAVDRFVAVPVVLGKRVFVAEGDGHFHAIVVAYDLATGERAWVSQVRASFESGIVPAADEQSLVVVDHYGGVTALDPADGAYLWERQLDRTVLQTRVALTARRVTVTTASMEVVVLDRANGRLVRRHGVRGVGGFAIDVRRVPSARRDQLVLAIRLGDHERVESWRLG